MDDTLAMAAGLLERVALPYVVIGGHAVNVWLEPRFTAHVDVTVQAGAGDMARLKSTLALAGYSVVREHGGTLPSGPDFVRFQSRGGTPTLEVQAAKTEFQREAVRRALVEGGLHVATAEDLIVLKLIANRPKDQNDLRGLAQLPDLDWPYVEHWASEWGVLDELRRLRASLG
jgi:hypothetical protein